MGRWSTVLSPLPPLQLPGGLESARLRPPLPKPILPPCPPAPPAAGWRSATPIAYHRLPPLQLPGGLRLRPPLPKPILSPRPLQLAGGLPPL